MARRTSPVVAFLLALTSALAITLTQVALAWLMSGQSTLEGAYLALERWDSGWYRSIIEKGYEASEPPTEKYPGNVAFFPAYPLAAWLVQGAFGLPTRVCMPLTSQFACWGFWTYVLLLCRRWRVPLPWRVAGVALILAHPAAYYLVAGYSESLFLVNLVGFLYWSEKKGRAAAVAACVHGFLMTATRLVGLPVVIYPLVRAWLRRGDDTAPLLKRLLVPGLVSVVAGCGALSFFLFCQVRFGHWDAYMRAGEAGWGLSRHYFVPLKRSFYRNTLEGGPADWKMNHTAAVLMEAILGVLVLAEVLRARRNGAAWRDRAGLYGAAAFLWYVPLTATHPCYPGMIRYVLCTHVLVALAAIHFLVRERVYWGRAGKLALTLAIGVLFAYQLLLTYRFTHGDWVA